MHSTRHTCTTQEQLHGQIAHFVVHLCRDRAVVPQARDQKESR